MNRLAVIALLAGVAFAQSPPYPPSPVIRTVTFDWSTHKRDAQGSDNWQLTWADDGHQYGAWGDGGGFSGTNSDGRVSLGVARIEGNWNSYRGFNVWGGKNAANPAGLDGKSWGMICIKGVLYMWVSPGSPLAVMQREARLYRSRDHAATWEPAAWAFTREQSLTIPTICQFGQDYNGSRDGYVYHYFIHPQDVASDSIQKPGRVYLARSPKERLMDTGAYEFFAGKTGKDPSWSADVTRKAPVFEDPAGVGWVLSVSYNAGLRRYILMTDHHMSNRGNLGIFEAPDPWGPWSTSLYLNESEGNNFGNGRIEANTFFWNMPAKWQSTDGRDFTLVFTGSGRGKNNDSFNLIRGTFELQPAGARETAVPMGQKDSSRAVLLAAALIAAPCSRGLDSSLQFSQYHTAAWHIEQGLPNNHVTAVLQPGDGPLLVGTRAGIVRFDGVSFLAPEGADPLAALAREWITGLLLRRDGTLIIATYNAGVFASKDGHTTRISSEKRVFSLFEDRGGTLWLAAKLAVLREQGGSFQVVLEGQAHPDFGWRAFAEDADGTIWIVAQSGLAAYRNGLVKLAVPNTKALGEAVSVWTLDGGIGVGTTRGAGGLTREHGVARVLPVASTGVPVVDCWRDDDGSLWWSTWGKGLIRMRGGRRETLDTGSGLDDDFVRVVARDREGSLWIGTRSGGLLQMGDSRIVPYGVPEGLRGHYASVVLERASGALWLGTWRNGVHQVNGSRVARVDLPVPAWSVQVIALAEDPRGRIWIGGPGRLSLIEADRIVDRTSLLPPQSGHVRAIHFDRAGRMWLGTGARGLLLVTAVEGELQVERVPGPSNVKQLLEDSRGRIWVATNAGLYRLDDRTQQLILLSPERQSITGIAEDGDKRIWAAAVTAALVVIDAQDRVRVLDATHGVPTMPLLHVVDDLRGSMWFSSAQGIWELKRDDAWRMLAGERPRVGFVKHGAGSGMRSIECMAEGNPAGLRRKDGSVWFPTARGFVMVKPVAGPPLAPPASEVLSISAGGRPMPAGVPIRLQPGTRNVEIRYTAYRLASPAGLRFRYRLHAGGDWTDAGSERSIRFVELPPGRFEFAVSARDAGGEFGPPSPVLVFEQAPSFRQTLLFKALLGLAVVTLVCAGMYWRLRSQRARYAAVLAERNRISDEWHDTLLAGLSAVAWQLDALDNDMTERSGPRKRLEMARKMVEHCRVEARRVIWDLHDGDRLESKLSDVVLRAAEGIASSAGAQVSIRAEGRVRPLDGIVEVNALRICQEAVTNAVRHGKARHVALSLDYGTDVLHLCVTDDGCGFDPGMQTIRAGHFGIAGMEARARRLGGRFLVRSEGGRGTTIEAGLPVPSAGEKETT